MVKVTIPNLLKDFPDYREAVEKQERILKRIHELEAEFGQVVEAPALPAVSDMSISELLGETPLPEPPAKGRPREEILLELTRFRRAYELQTELVEMAHKQASQKACAGYDKPLADIADRVCNHLAEALKVMMEAEQLHERLASAGYRRPLWYVQDFPLAVDTLVAAVMGSEMDFRTLASPASWYVAKLLRLGLISERHPIFRVANGLLPKLKGESS